MTRTTPAPTATQLIDARGRHHMYSNHNLASLIFGITSACLLADGADFGRDQPSTLVRDVSRAAFGTRVLLFLNSIVFAACAVGLDVPQILVDGS
jgi:hypothetical protein